MLKGMVLDMLKEKHVKSRTNEDDLLSPASDRLQSLITRS